MGYELCAGPGARILFSRMNMPGIRRKIAICSKKHRGAYSDLQPGGREYTLTGTGTPERLRGAQVTESFLNVLGVTPQLGRNFLPEEDRPAGSKAVLVSNAVWS